MTLLERLESCKICENKKFDPNRGIVCGLTNEKPDFENTCPSFQLSKKYAAQEKVTKRIVSEFGPTPVDSGLRFANYIVDNIGVYIFAVIIGVLLFLVLSVLDPELLDDYLYNDTLLFDWLLGLAITVLYYFGFESALGRTPGKLVTGTKVVDENGNKPTLKMIFVRTLCRFIPFEAFSFLGSNTGWHDTISKTRVVKVR